MPRLIGIPELYQRPHTHTIEDLGSALRDLGMPFAPRKSRSRALASRALSRLPVGRFLDRQEVAYFAGMMWPSPTRVLPQAYFTEIVPFIFDCWPRHYASWAKLFRRLRVRTASFTARASAEHFQRSQVLENVTWIPEAVEPSRYWSERPLALRQTDVLEIGRRHAVAHAALTTSTLRVRTSETGPPIRGNAALAAALGDSKILVCYPKSDTHPELADNVETVTLRYFEGMAAGCLLIGRAPQELIDLCGYDPVVPAPPASAAEVASSLVRDIERHQGLVARNHEFVRTRGSWAWRAKEAIDFYRRNGYDLPDGAWRDDLGHRPQ
jgi:hypothetical protein